MTATPRFGALAPLLAPASVAVIGASDREGNLGGLCVAYLRKFGFAGPVWPVNAGRGEVGGLRCHPDLAALPAAPDLAVIAVPAESVAAVARDCIAHGVKAAVVWAGGFAEGDEQGRARQRELEDAVRGSGMLLCGPNCIGVINTSIGLTASFSSLMSELDAFNPGTVSIVSQSGGIAVTSHARAQELGLGFRLTISCGNEATLGLPQFIDALVDDDGTRVVCVYTEGLSDPGAFAAALGRAREAGKPVVVLKGGATEAAGRAALAHTGRLAGLDRTYDAIFREFAAIRVHSTEEMLDVALHLAALPPGQLPRGERVLLSTFGGGSGVIGTDQCAREGLAVPPLDAALRERVRPIVSPLASTMNPIDLTPSVYNQPEFFARFGDALDLIAADPAIDSVLVQFGPMGLRGMEVARELVAFSRRCPKHVAIAWPLAPRGVVEYLRDEGVHVFDAYGRSVTVLARLARHAADRSEAIALAPATGGFDWAAHAGQVADGSVISEHDCHRILRAAGLPVAAGSLAATADEAAAAWRAIGAPVAMKGISPQVTHRAAAGLVALDLRDEAGVRRAFDELSATARGSAVALDGVYVQEMVAGGSEVIVSALRDPVAGVVVSCGAGGALTELIDDVVIARAPLDVAGARALLGRLRLVRGLAKGRKPPDLDALARFVADFSQVAARAPWTRFVVEVNPVKWSTKGVTAVDGLVIIEEC